jgi:L-aspartate oxidase
VMKGVHPQEDLAPRDVVASAISRRMATAPAGVDDHVFLDATHMGDRFHTRFPGITAACREAGIEPTRDRIPVAPAAHYVCGGVAAGLDGRTELLGLYAVGEVACTGVHGANRLASNSLTEGVVAGTRVGRDLAWELPEDVSWVETDAPSTLGLVPPGRRSAIRTAMSKHVGVLRSPEGLAAAADALRVPCDGREWSRDAWEATNLLTVAQAVVAAATLRTESRGCHRRTDVTEPLDIWLRHLDVRLEAIDPVAGDATGDPMSNPMWGLMSDLMGVIVVSGAPAPETEPETAVTAGE